ncbi:MAG TPA: winged helix-turn-helix domain-containing protein [Patescibacteria group bacterium]|nr:winged helix-turn-helix domain-containing protein [Patescibacteria group bacterium]
MSRRSKLDLVLGVLRVVRGGVDKPTRIMYAVNLSWRPTQGILGGLVEQGLLAEVEVEGEKRSRRRYVVTEKGLGVLSYFDGASALLDLDEVITQE